MSKTIAMTIQVVTTSTVTVLVEVPDGIGPSRYDYIAQRLIESTPSGMYTEITRSYEKVSFAKSDIQARLTVRFDDEMELQLVKKNDPVELTLFECGDLEDFEYFVLYSGIDDQDQCIVTLPAAGSEMHEITIKVFPFTVEVIDEVKRKLAKSFYHGALPDSAPLTVIDFGDDVNVMSGSDPYFEMAVKIRRPRSAYSVSDAEEFAEFMFFRDCDTELHVAISDIKNAYEQYEKSHLIVASF